MITLASGLCDGDMSKLANIINMAFKHVSDDIVPLSNEQYIAAEVVPEQYIISVCLMFKKNLVKSKLTKLLALTGYQTKYLRPLLTCWRLPCVQYLIVHLEKVMCHRCGNLHL